MWLLRRSQKCSGGAGDSLVTATCLLAFPSSMTSMTSSGLDTKRSVQPWQEEDAVWGQSQLQICGRPWRRHVPSRKEPCSCLRGQRGWSLILGDKTMVNRQKATEGNNSKSEKPFKVLDCDWLELWPAFLFPLCFASSPQMQKTDYEPSRDEELVHSEPFSDLLLYFHLRRHQKD